MRRLPVLIEKSVAELQAHRIGLAKDFELQVLAGDEGTTCQKGCHSCCYHPVVISLFEGIAVYQQLAESHVWTAALRKRFEQVAQKTWNLSAEVWLLSMIGCPLLSDRGECSAYEARPLACKITYAVGDPYYCHPHRIGANTKLIPKKEVLQTLDRVERSTLKKYDLEYIKLDFASAVLYGERIYKATDLEDICIEIRKNYADRG